MSDSLVKIKIARKYDIDINIDISITRGHAPRFQGEDVIWALRRGRCKPLFQRGEHPPRFFFRVRVIFKL